MGKKKSVGDKELEPENGESDFFPIPHSPLPTPRSSVNFWFRRLGFGAQKIEVASLIGLRDMLAEERAIATLITRRRRRPFGAAARHLFFADQQIQFSTRHVQFY